MKIHSTGVVHCCQQISKMYRLYAFQTRYPRVTVYMKNQDFAEISWIKFIVLPTQDTHTTTQDNRNTFQAPLNQV